MHAQQGDVDDAERLRLVSGLQLQGGVDQLLQLSVHVQAPCLLSHIRQHSHHAIKPYIHTQLCYINLTAHQKVGKMVVVVVESEFKEEKRVIFRVDSESEGMYLQLNFGTYGESKFRVDY